MRTENNTPTSAGSAEARAGRPALDAGAVRQAVLTPGGLWQTVEVTAATGSTNADLLARAASGAPEGAVLAADEQRAGRGRLGRAWVSPPRAALTFSLLLRPQGVPPARRGWLPLLAGVAVTAAVRSVASVEARLKWPNDVLAGPAKLGGILAEASGNAVVIGIGLNVSTEPGRTAAARPGRPARDVSAHPRRARSEPGTPARRDPGGLRALVPGLAAGGR